MRSSIIVIVSTFLCVAFSLPVKRTIFGPQCHKMESAFCADAGMFPPGVRMNTTVSASDRALTEETLKGFSHLIATECAAELKKFLCFAYYPMCLRDEGGESYQIQPCRSSCQAVRSKCELFVVAAGGRWPDALDCDAMPERLCMPVVAEDNPSAAAEPSKCDDCAVETKPAAIVQEICQPHPSKLFVKARVLTEEVIGEGKSLVYYVQIEQILSGKSEVLEPQSTIWVITTSREDCDCHQLSSHESYLLALQPQTYDNLVLYLLNGDAVVSEWSAVKDIQKQIENCPQPAE